MRATDQLSQFLIRQAWIMRTGVSGYKSRHFGSPGKVFVGTACRKPLETTVYFSLIGNRFIIGYKCHPESC